ncbi:MAG TPA: HAD hydrolase-like protein [Gemmatimonadaceae bacterium]|nr:HAD hydrolase-like protein [Gemmatimonadaceae bacterium]
MTQSTAVRLVLFDVDGTLLDTRGAGRRAMAAALARLGVLDPDSYRYDGKTDPQIVRDLLRLAGHDDAAADTRMTEVLSEYVRGLERELVNGDAPRPCHGIVEMLDTLEARDDVVLGLLTGNVRRGAELKLRAAGIDPGRFRVGAYGSDHHERPALPVVAQRRARELLGLTLHAGALVVIGDTPADIACARAVGARAVGVATGRYSVEELAAHAPAAVVPSFADLDAGLGAILGS